MGVAVSDHYMKLREAWKDDPRFVDRETRGIDWKIQWMEKRDVNTKEAIKCLQK